MLDFCWFSGEILWRTLWRKKWRATRFFVCKDDPKLRLMRLEVLRHIEPRMVPNVEVVGGAAVACDGTPGPRGRSTPEHDRVHDSPPALVTGTGTVTDRRGVDPPSPQTGDSLWKVGRDPLTGVGPAMEGTSGAAERALLRGRAGEAALSCESSRQRAPGRAGARAPGQRGGFVAGGQTNSRRRRRLRAADRHEPTTGGVRADRVGAKRSPRAVAVDGVIQRRNTSSLPKTPDP